MFSLVPGNKYERSCSPLDWYLGSAGFGCGACASAAVENRSRSTTTTRDLNISLPPPVVITAYNATSTGAGLQEFAMADKILLPSKKSRHWQSLWRFMWSYSILSEFDLASAHRCSLTMSEIRSYRMRCTSN